MGDVKEFRKKPVVIQAIQWDGTLSGMDEILSVFTDIRTVAKTSHPPTNTCSFWKIRTLEGSHEVSAHDFVIRGVKGEYYPCKPDIFFMTYEPATATPPADAALEVLATYLEQRGLDYAYGSYPQEMLNKAAAALRAHQPAQAVADGFALVPKELTESMYRAGVEAISGTWMNPDGTAPVGGYGSYVRRVWPALLAASKEDVNNVLP